MAVDKFEGLDEARARHPGWGIWISSAGRYWATRRGNVQVAVHSPPGWAMTVDADSLAGVEKRIEEQEALCSHFGRALHGSSSGAESTDQ